MGDPYFDQVKLLLHFDGTNGSTTFTDVKGHTFTAYGNAQISTTQSKFGGASGYFDGTGDFLTTPQSTDFDFGSGDFTVETWAYFTGWNSSQSNILVCKWANPYSWCFVYQSTSHTLEFWIYVGGAGVWTITASTTLSLNTEYHLAVARQGSSWRFFVNGNLIGTATNTSTIDTVSSVLAIGGAGDSSGQIAGYLDDMRITKGAARYTINFTPPTSAFSDSLGDIGVYPSLFQKNILSVWSAGSTAVVPIKATRDQYGTASISGTATKNGKILAWAVIRVYRHADGVYVDQYFANGEGIFICTGLQAGYAYIITAIDPAGAYNAIIYDNVIAV